jgi:hypothetical protein
VVLITFLDFAKVVILVIPGSPVITKGKKLGDSFWSVGPSVGRSVERSVEPRLNPKGNMKFRPR